jgi:hypothetical protein
MPLVRHLSYRNFAWSNNIVYLIIVSSILHLVNFPRPTVHDLTWRSCFVGQALILHPTYVSLLLRLAAAKECRIRSSAVIMYVGGEISKAWHAMFKLTPLYYFIRISTIFILLTPFLLRTVLCWPWIVDGVWPPDPMIEYLTNHPYVIYIWRMPPPIASYKMT